MRSTAGFTLAAALVVGAFRFISSPATQAGPGTSPPPHPLADAQAAPAKNPATPTTPTSGYTGGCTAFDPEKPSAPLPRDDSRAAASSLLESLIGPQSSATYPPSVRYAIALTADPLHTNLSLLFDRTMVTIQQAAQDQGYTYNSSWLPWRDDPHPLSGLTDRQLQASFTNQREACPGILLFRRSVSDSAPAVKQDPYSDALVVFLVGEQPTGGLNEDQWSNTIHWLATHAPTQPAASSLSILGPTFSGSLVSLERALSRIYRPESPESQKPDATTLRAKFPAALVLSGSVRGCTSIRWFQGQLAQPGFKNAVDFGSFQENDELQVDRFLRYLTAQGGHGKDTAMLAEDETAYANPSPDSSKPSSPTTQADPTPHCEFLYGSDTRPLRLSYPRDISALRTAYEKQSIFSTETSDGHTTKAVLQGDDATTDPSTDAVDTIPTFSGKLTPVAQEAVLYGIVSFLRTHHTRFLLLRCTNQLDFLFLTRFFHRAYPEGRIVTVGSDILFRREIDSTEFRGVMALSTFPLLPRDQHWTALFSPSEPPPNFLHTHRVFEDQTQQGLYLAARYLFDRSPPQVQPRPSSLLLPFKSSLPGIADPFWLHASGPFPAETSSPTWLSVVGRDGYWPVAVLNDHPGYRPPPPPDLLDLPDPALDRSGHDPRSTIVRITASVNSAATPPVAKPVRYDPAPPGANQSANPDPTPPSFSKSLLFSPSLSWKIVCGLAVCLLVYQAFAIAFGTRLSSIRLLAGFRKVGSRSQALLIGLNCAFAIFLLLEPLSFLFCIPHALIAPDNHIVWVCVGLAAASTLGLAWLLYVRFSPLAMLYFILSLASLALISLITLLNGINPADGFPLALRIAHPTSGVSPLLPVLFIFGGFYLWSWQAISGNSLLCCGRPLLPQLALPKPFSSWHQDLGNFIGKRLKRPAHPPALTPAQAQVSAPAPAQAPAQTPPPAPAPAPIPPVQGINPSLSHLSQKVGDSIFYLAAPFSLPLPVVVPVLVLLFGAWLYFHNDLPLLTIEGHAFTLWLNLGLLVAFLLTTAEAARLYLTWHELHYLLTALNQTRLRRTFARIRAIDTHSLWAVSGNARTIQALFFSHQCDAAGRLLRLPGGETPLLRSAVETGRAIASENNGNPEGGSLWHQPLRALDPTGKTTIRTLFAEAVAETLNRLLPVWESETDSLTLETPSIVSDSHGICMDLSNDEAVRAAEEFVCFHYILFIQNILARMRTMTFSMAALFVAVCFAISFYPFVPRTEIGIWMLANLALISTSVLVVYAAMERDATLSYMANSQPGQLSSAFWLKSASFLIGPVLGVLTTQFPAIADSFLAWVQPGLDAISK